MQNVYSVLVFVVSCKYAALALKTVQKIRWPKKKHRLCLLWLVFIVTTAKSHHALWCYLIFDKLLPSKQPGKYFLSCCGWAVQALVIVLCQIQVTLPQVSAQREHDQPHTVFILSLPVVIAAVPAGSLPSALPLTSSLSMPHMLSAKMQTKHAVPDWSNTGGNTAEARHICYCLKANSGSQLKGSCSEFVYI